MTQDRFRRLRYSGASINLLGLLLSVGAWAYKVWLFSRFPQQLSYANATWVVGGFCWFLGLGLFLGGWLFER
jgi:hypothetical protein